MLKDMRSMLELFRSQGDLRSVTESVSLVHGVAAGIRATSQMSGPALYFENVEGAIRHSAPTPIRTLRNSPMRWPSRSNR